MMNKPVIAVIAKIERLNVIEDRQKGSMDNKINYFVK
jgi:hypothetical protein